ncbi:hypothetical protein [Prevotella sp. HUN102]|uniref:hypothetical protein n=1 Tax=Prevotella sp. HUN102 TaxID=1392486 RepID=UPI0012DDFF60|nr:hypothetical protein [Prevotella sp. HUN102]
MEKGHYHVLLVPLHALLQTAIFKHLTDFLLLLAQSIFYCEFLILFRKRESKAQYLCGLLIVLLFIIFILGFVSPVPWFNTGIYLPSIFFLSKEIIILSLSIFFIVLFRGYVRLSGFAASTSIILPNLILPAMASCASANALNILVEVINPITTLCLFLSYLFCFKSFKPRE